MIEVRIVISKTDWVYNFSKCFFSSTSPLVMSLVWYGLLKEGSIERWKLVLQKGYSLSPALLMHRNYWLSLCTIHRYCYREGEGCMRCENKNELATYLPIPHMIIYPHIDIILLLFLREIYILMLLVYLPPKTLLIKIFIPHPLSHIQCTIWYRWPPHSPGKKLMTALSKC